MRVLIVDDAELTAAALATFFEMRGHGVRAVGSGGDALDALGGVNFDAVVLDQKLPGALDGLHVLREMRAMSYDAPVVMCTAVDARTADALAKELASLQPAVLVRKPAVPSELLDAIMALRAWHE